MEGRDHHDAVLLGEVDDAVGEPAGQGAPDLVGDGRDLRQRPADSFKGVHQDRAGPPAAGPEVMPVDQRSQVRGLVPEKVPETLALWPLPSPLSTKLPAQLTEPSSWTSTEVISSAKPVTPPT